MNGYWNEHTLTFANRPPTNLSNFITVTPNDMQELEGVVFDYSKDITPFVNDWLNNDVPDYGIRVSSDSGHVFVSKESIFESASKPSISLHLSSPKNTNSRVLNMGYVQAGDTLMLDYMGISDNFRPTFTNNPVNADDRLSFFKYSNCQTHTYLNLLPHMEENTAQSPYFEFALSNELTLPSDEQGYRDIYIEPNILYDNGLASLPGWMFSNYFASLHEVSPVDIPEGTPGHPGGIMPVALLDGSPNGWAPFSPYNTGTTINYLSHPLAIGKTFKLVIAGIIRKGGGIATKSNPNAPDLQDITQVIQGAFSESYPDLSVATANCGLNPFGEAQEGLFVSCFEFSIGGNSTEIMLGESKYFYAVEDSEDPASLLIKELDVNNEDTEALTLPSDGIEDAFSGDDIIKVLSGGKSGVYWERKRTLIDDNGTLTVQDLPEGVVRLIGRYWEANKEYSVNLHATSGNRSGQLEIKVVKPDKYGSSNHTYIDGLENSFNADSLITIFAGKNGFMPQVLKSLMEKESSFLAAYRYEPGLDWYYQVTLPIRDDTSRKARIRENPYWIESETNVGSPTIPFDHIVHEQQGYGNRYPGYDGNFFDLFVSERSKRINNISVLQNKINEYVIEVIDSLTSLNESFDTSRINQLANNRLNGWVRNDFLGGLELIPKQTRQLASFGPLQLIYFFGYFEGAYPENTDFLPESMNMNFDAGIQRPINFFINQKFNNNRASRTGIKFSNSGNWPLGYEESFKRVANAYHGLSGRDAPNGVYGKDVLIRSKKYSPKK